eukprot:gene5411-7499_t
MGCLYSKSVDNLSNHIVTQEISTNSVISNPIFINTATGDNCICTEEINLKEEKNQKIELHEIENISSYNVPQSSSTIASSIIENNEDDKRMTNQINVTQEISMDHITLVPTIFSSINKTASSVVIGTEENYLKEEKNQEIEMHEIENISSYNVPQSSSAIASITENNEDNKRVTQINIDQIEDDKHTGGVIILKTEERGITILQLKAVYEEIVSRCEVEGWTDQTGNLLTPEKVNLYVVNAKIITPSTSTRKCSFVETVAK